MTEQNTTQNEAPKFNINDLDMGMALRGASLKKKISVKTVYGKPDPRTIPENGSIPVMRVMGQVTGLRTGQGDFGPWVAFKGEFIAVNLGTGESFKGSQLFLPEVASDLIENAVINAEGSNVNVAFDIEAIRGRTSDDFEYTAKPHMEVEESDPLLMLVKAMDSKIKNLAAPIDTTAAEPEKAKEVEPEKAPVEAVVADQQNNKQNPKHNSKNNKHGKNK